MCPCCYDDLDVTKAVMMEDCGHYLCEECFRYHCQEKLKQGPNVVQAACPEASCRAIVSKQTFQELLTDAEF